MVQTKILAALAIVGLATSVNARDISGSVRATADQVTGATQATADAATSSAQNIAKGISAAGQSLSDAAKSLAKNVHAAAVSSANGTSKAVNSVADATSQAAASVSKAVQSGAQAVANFSTSAGKNVSASARTLATSLWDATVATGKGLNGLSQGSTNASAQASQSISGRTAMEQAQIDELGNAFLAYRDANLAGVELEVQYKYNDFVDAAEKLNPSLTAEDLVAGLNLFAEMTASL